MQPVTVTRADLAWALGAVLPHCGDAASGRDWVGIYVNTGNRNILYYATDGYTVGIAGATFTFNTFAQPIFDIALQKKEAQDLLRLVRPTLRRHDTQPVELLYVPCIACSDPMDHMGCPNELHAGLPPSESESEGLSEVFEVMTPGVSFQDVYGMLSQIKQAVWDGNEGLNFSPDYTARFAKAGRYETDRLTIHPRQSDDGRTASYITVGDRFEGAIAGMKPAQQPEEQEAA